MKSGSGKFSADNLEAGDPNRGGIGTYFRLWHSIHGIRTLASEFLITEIAEFRVDFTRTKRGLREAAVEDQINYRRVSVALNEAFTALVRV